MNENTFSALYYIIQEICPYNYEAIGLVLNKLQDFVSSGFITPDHAKFVRLNDYFTLMQFLKYMLYIITN